MNGSRRELLRFAGNGRLWVAIGIFGTRMLYVPWSLDDVSLVLGLNGFPSIEGTCTLHYLYPFFVGYLAICFWLL
jgi:hypothetical protein